MVSRIVQATSAFVCPSAPAIEFTQSPTPRAALMLASKGAGPDVKTMFLLATIYFIVSRHSKPASTAQRTSSPLDRLFHPRCPADIAGDLEIAQDKNEMHIHVGVKQPLPQKVTRARRSLDKAQSERRTTLVSRQSNRNLRLADRTPLSGVPN